MELAFLRAFLAWEAFLEESFILYLLGRTSPGGYSPKRYYFPPNQTMATEWLAEGKDYAKWANCQEVERRAFRHFEQGSPFSQSLRSNQSVLSDANAIRNMIAHESASAQVKFESIVRRELGTLPITGTAGAFLGMTVPTSTPPISFLDFYISKFESCAALIIP